jgi:hypothetical protein
MTTSHFEVAHGNYKRHRCILNCETMKTKIADKFISVNPRFKTREDVLNDDVFTFEEENIEVMDIFYDGKRVLKSSLTKSQFEFLRDSVFQPHRLFVSIYTRPNLKDGNHFLMMAGIKQIEDAFNGEFIYLDQKQYYLEYPERWLNVIEQRMLYTFLHLTFPNSCFHIKTHSVYIIQCTANVSCGIMDEAFSEGGCVNYQDFVNNTVKTCHALEDESGLMVL